MGLQEVWFVLVAVLFIGYFVLEGFDFGVGMLMPIVGRGSDLPADTRRRVALNTIGPVWDGNEVWLITAGGAMFAAFPEWYATLFSGFYLPLLIILVALIVRICAIEWRSKIDDDKWRQRCDWGIIFGSWVPAVLWGVAFANIVRGVAINADKQVESGFFDLLNPYALLGGLTTALVFALHGAVFLALKSADEVREDAVKIAARLAIPAIPVAGGFVLWTQTRLRQGVDVDSGSRCCCCTDRRRLPDAGRARRLGLRSHLCGRHRHRRAAVRLAVPERHAVDARSGVQPHHRERVVESVHAQGDDVGRGIHDAGGDHLPGLDVLGVPTAHLLQADSGVDRSAIQGEDVVVANPQSQKIRNTKELTVEFT